MNDKFKFLFSYILLFHGTRARNTVTFPDRGGSVAFCQIVKKIPGEKLEKPRIYLVCTLEFRESRDDRKKRNSDAFIFFLIVKRKMKRT